LILLCPAHHAVIDAAPATFTADWLSETRRRHEAAVLSALAASAPTSEPVVDPKKAIPFAKALQMWARNRENGDEEFWHQTFKSNPALLAIAFADCVVMYGDKCYVGGKDLSNSGGNVIDFLFAAQITRNVILIEIKTPLTPLVGNRYRAHAYSMAGELTGAVVQALAYRESLMKNFHSLVASMPSPIVGAVSPRAVVLAGQIEPLSPEERHSFELFRTALAAVQVLTYDELFSKVRDVCDLASVSYNSREPSA
jgi:hypothetical protein